MCNSGNCCERTETGTGRGTFNNRLMDCFWSQNYANNSQFLKKSLDVQCCVYEVVNWTRSTGRFVLSIGRAAAVIVRPNLNVYSHPGVTFTEFVFTLWNVASSLTPFHYLKQSQALLISYSKQVKRKLAVCSLITATIVYISTRPGCASFTAGVPCETATHSCL